MKKLGILVMAMVLVVGMSSGAMANLGEDDVDFSINVNETANVVFGTDSVDLVLEDLGEYKENFDVTVNANTAVTTSVKMEFDDGELGEVFDGKDNSDIFWSESDDDDWIISPNIAVKGVKNSHLGGYKDLKEGVEYSYLDLENNGTVTETLEFHATYNENGDFHEFNADEELTGDLVFTVTAAD